MLTLLVVLLSTTSVVVSVSLKYPKYEYLIFGLLYCFEWLVFALVWGDLGNIFFGGLVFGLFIVPLACTLLFAQLTLLLKKRTEARLYYFFGSLSLQFITFYVTLTYGS